MCQPPANQAFGAGCIRNFPQLGPMSIGSRRVGQSSSTLRQMGCDELPRLLAVADPPPKGFRNIPSTSLKEEAVCKRSHESWCSQRGIFRNSEFSASSRMVKESDLYEI